jgi:nucleotide-binding universal stress UspA family protein
MRWIVGIDLLDRSHGAVRMAAWLRSHYRGDSPAEFIAVHVVDERLRDSLKVMSEVLAEARRTLASAAARCGVPDPFTDVRVVLAPSVESGLARAATEPDIDGLVIGRVAPRDGHRLVRLGSVARKMLRDLPVPVMVVPPDLDDSDIGDGGIVLATDLGETSVAAARFSVRLANELGREVIATHMDPARDVSHDLLGDRTILASWTPRRTMADVQHWVQEHEIAVGRTRLVDDSVVEGLIAIAYHEKAAMLACGSRRLGTIDRIFTSSVGTDLARLAERPVLVVPSP